MSLEQCIDSAMANNPAVAAAALQVEKARILQGTAFDAPKTEITLKQETTGGGGPENGVAFGQEFEFPTLYVARHKSLSASTRLEESRFNRLAIELERDVTLAYYDLLYQRTLINLNDSLGKIYDEFCRVASERFNAGESGRLEMMNAKRVKEKNDMELRSLKIKYAGALSELKRLTGCRVDFDIDDREFGALPLDPTSEYLDFNTTAKGVEAERAVDAAERDIAVARNEFMPGIRLGATVQALIKGFNPYHVDRQRFEQGNFMGFEVGVTVPLFFGATSARLKAARTDKRIALLNREMAEAESRSESERLRATLTSVRESMEYFRTSALPDAREIERIARVSYELGDIDYLEYISNMETAYSVYREYADCLNDYNQTVINLTNLSR